MEDFSIISFSPTSATTSAQKLSASPPNHVMAFFSFLILAAVSRSCHLLWQLFITGLTPFPLRVVWSAPSGRTKRTLTKKRRKYKYFVSLFRRPSRDLRDVRNGVTFNDEITRRRKKHTPTHTDKQTFSDGFFLVRKAIKDPFCTHSCSSERMVATPADIEDIFLCFTYSFFSITEKNKEAILWCGDPLWQKLQFSYRRLPIVARGVTYSNTFDFLNNSVFIVVPGNYIMKKISELLSPSQIFYYIGFARSAVVLSHVMIRSTSLACIVPEGNRMSGSGKGELNCSSSAISSVGLQVFRATKRIHTWTKTSPLSTS